MPPEATLGTEKLPDFSTAPAHSFPKPLTDNLLGSHLSEEAGNSRVPCDVKQMGLGSSEWIWEATSDWHIWYYNWLYLCILKAETLLCQQRSIWSRLWFFQWSCMDVRVGLWRKLSAKELMLLNCGVGEDSWESLGLQGYPTSPPKGDQSWVIIGRTDAEPETPILWPPHSKSWLIGKDPDAGRDWGQEEKGMTEDEMAGWPHQLDGHGFE